MIPKVEELEIVEVPPALGDLAQDLITGFGGVVIKIAEDISGARIATLKRPNSNPANQFYSDNRVECEFPIAGLKVITPGYIAKERSA